MNISFKEFQVTVNLLLMKLPGGKTRDEQFEEALYVRGQIGALGLLVRGNESRGSDRVGKLLDEAYQKTDKAVKAAIDRPGEINGSFTA